MPVNHYSRKRQDYCGSGKKPMKPQNLMCSLFVYGSLKQEHENNHIIRKHGGKLIGKGWTNLSDYVLYYIKAENGFPVVLKAQGEKPARIQGELYRVPRIKMQEIDGFEGVKGDNSGPYMRRMIDVSFYFLGHSTVKDKVPYTTTAWMYLGIRENWQDILAAKESIGIAPHYTMKREGISYYQFSKFLIKPPFEAVSAREKGIS
jgi:gamma-glutamylcyclotransferase (GGCT)/AIG2-like uncharacterized protein YtfP